MAEVLAGIRSRILSHKNRVRGVVEVVEVARELRLIGTLSVGWKQLHVRSAAIRCLSCGEVLVYPLAREPTDHLRLQPKLHISCD